MLLSSLLNLLQLVSLRFLCSFCGNWEVPKLYRMYLWSDTLQLRISFRAPMFHIVKSKTSYLTPKMNVGTFTLFWINRPCVMRHSRRLSPLRLTSGYKTLIKHWYVFGIELQIWVEKIWTEFKKNMKKIILKIRKNWKEIWGKIETNFRVFHFFSTFSASPMKRAGPERHCDSPYSLFETE